MINVTGGVSQRNGLCGRQYAVKRGSLVYLIIIILVATLGWAEETRTASPAWQVAQSTATPQAANASAQTSDHNMRWIETSAENINKGKTFFAACGACHGLQGEGRQGIGPRLNSKTFLAAASDDFLMQTISKGRAGTTMIPWGASYQPDVIESIIAYIRSLNPVPPATLNESPLAGDATSGQELYASICAACHGRTGAGYQETANGTGIGRAAFLNEVSNGYLRYIIKHGKSGTKMRPFDEASKVAVANLTDQQIDDVIAYLRSQSW
jgi:cbb3-type cytochrome c oxidase subunit III